MQKYGETIYLDTMPKEELKKLYVGLGQKEGNHVEVGTDGEGNYTLNIFTTFAKGGIANHFRERVGLRSGTALASYPPFRGTSGSSGALKAWRGAEMKETLPKSWLPEAGALTSSAILALRDRKPKDESKEDIVESIETIKKEPDQEPPEDPWDPNKLLEVLESTTYNIAENRVKKKAWNYVEKKINERAIELAKKYPNDQNKRRGILGKEFNEFLGKGVDVAGVTKDGTVSYRKGWEKELGYPRSTDLIGTVNERNDKRIKAEAPFRNKGYVTTREFVKILGDKGMEITLGTGTDNRPTIEKQIGQFAKTYGVEILSRGDAQNLGYWIKLPSDKKIEKIVKQNLSEDSKVEVIKNLVEEYDLKSWGQINKALLHEGYVGERGEFFEKHFPQLKGTHFSDKDFVYSKKVPAVIQRIRKQMIENWGSPSLEKFLTSAKHAEGFGEVVHLMHTEQKKKRSETSYNFGDLAFGSEAENFEYNKGLDNMRNSFTLALKTIKHDYEGKDLNQKINVPFHLQEKFDFPKTMTVKKYVDRLNYMLTDLAYLTGGKVRGELLDVWGKKMNFIENPAIDYSIVPGKGFLEGKLKKYEGLFKKFKNEVIDGKATGRLVIGEDGYPVLKKGQKLTQNQAEILMTIVEGLATQLTSASESKPVSLETFKEIIQPLSKKAEGGPVLSGVDQYIINRGL